MKYICLAYEEESILNSLSKGEWDSLRAETLSYVDGLKRHGTLVATEPLQSVQNATTVRMRNGKLSITDGPFAETKETLGGFFLIDVADLNEAIQVAVNWPSVRFGSVEVRPIEDELGKDGRYERITA